MTKSARKSYVSLDCSGIRVRYVRSPNTSLVRVRIVISFGTNDNDTSTRYSATTTTDVVTALSWSPFMPRSHVDLYHKAWLRDKRFDYQAFDLYYRLHPTRYNRNRIIFSGATVQTMKIGIHCSLTTTPWVIKRCKFYL